MVSILFFYFNFTGNNIMTNKTITIPADVITGESKRIIVKEAKVGQVIELIKAYCKINNVDVANAAQIAEDKGGEQFAETLQKLANARSLVTGAPMLSQAFNELVAVQIIAEQGTREGDYNDLTFSELTEVIESVKEVNNSFFVMVKNLI